jgi:hypothetical protein
VLGVKCFVDGRKELLGLKTFFDDSVLQNQFNNLCHPHPRFRYEAVPYNNHDFAYIEIPTDTSIGPISPIYDVGNILRSHAIYYRRNSSNSLADVEEQKNIFAWFKGSRDVRPLSNSSDPLWDQFVRAVHNFDLSRKYFLIASPLVLQEGGPAENLSNVPWLFVADFDHKSLTEGLLSHADKALSKLASVHKLTLDINISVISTGATYWYFARGIEERESTLSIGRWIEWKGAYAKDITGRLSRLAKAISSPVTVVVLWADSSLNRHLDTFLSYLHDSFGDSIDIVIVSTLSCGCQDIAEQYNAKSFLLSMNQFFHGLGFVQQTNQTNRRKTVFPSSSGADIALDDRTVAWLNEELELVHKNSGLSPDGFEASHSSFLRGREVSWFELGLHLDVDRDIAEKIRKTIRRDLDTRSMSRINLYHAPGAGGTTVARRLLWDLRIDFPSVLIHRTQPQETVERIKSIYKETNKSVFIVVDGSRISDRQSDELFTLLSASNTPFVILQVLRRFDILQSSDRSFYLDQVLSLLECARFSAALQREKPERKLYIDSAARAQDSRYRSPFF